MGAVHPGYKWLAGSGRARQAAPLPDLLVAALLAAPGEESALSYWLALRAGDAGQAESKGSPICRSSRSSRLSARWRSSRRMGPTRRGGSAR
ncbi:hypothetical protein NITHO_1270006 [Nitrolancea hollandica Lb]|uniref:Uncharacterized protein n=1 Tax=Nitrolancea hollandica Lb TaxID=1129897 RepID=I4ECY0_9BACT|nr:hypothetical protein NITHO_1270006 [Nitrolancea hollandica Lb]